MIEDPARVLSELGDDGARCKHTTRHYLMCATWMAASYTWKFAFSRGFADDGLTSSYIDVYFEAGDTMRRSGTGPNSRKSAMGQPE